jgi:hypothetical protein
LIRLVDSSSFTARSSAFWLISCTIPDVRNRQLEHTVTSDLDKIYQGKLIDRNVDYLTHAAQVVPWEVHHLECVIVLSSRSWQHGCFVRSTRTLQD